MAIYKFIYGFILILCVSSQPPDQWLKKYLVELKTTLKTGDPSLGIPVLDPYHFNKTLHWNQDLFKSNLQIQGTLSGISDYDVIFASLDTDLNLDVHLVFHGINFKGVYNASDGLIYKLVPLEGHGNLKFDVQLKFKIEAKNRIIQLSKFYFGYKCTHFKILIDGVLDEYGFGNLIKNVLADLSETVVHRLRHHLERLVNSYVLGAGNMALRHFGLKDLIEATK